MATTSMLTTMATTTSQPSTITSAATQENSEKTQETSRENRPDDKDTPKGRSTEGKGSIMKEDNESGGKKLHASQIVIVLSLIMLTMLHIA